MAKLFTLTDKQRQSLATVRAIRDLHAKQFSENRAVLLSINPNAQSSEWVSINTLTVVHHVSRRDIDSLVKKGVISVQGGEFGQEVKIIERSA